MLVILNISEAQVDFFSNVFRSACHYTEFSEMTDHQPNPTTKSWLFLNSFYRDILSFLCLQSQSPPTGEGSSEQQDDQGQDKKQKENTAYAKKVVLRLAGLMGLGGAVGMVYIFGELILWDESSVRRLNGFWTEGVYRKYFGVNLMEYLTSGVSCTLD